jgi:hypothetical protein
MPDVIHGNTQLGPTKQDVIAAIAQRELKFAAKLAPFFTDLSSLAVKGAKSISVPKLGSFTAVNRASAAAGDATVIGATVDTLALNQTSYLSWIVDSADEVQSTLDYELLLVGRAAAAHGRKFDTDVITEVLAVGEEIATGAISQANVLLMREYIRKNVGNLAQTFLCVSPEDERVLLGIDEFSRADVFGAAVIQTGVMGRIYGVNVLVHEGLTSGQYFMAEAGGLAYAFQSGPQISAQGANQYGSQAQRFAMDQLYGVKGMQMSQGTASTGKSALIAIAGA